MLKLKTLKFKGIGRFVSEQLIEFDKLGKFVQVDANNQNTGGSSGSGKSTIFMALDYLFGVSNRPHTVLKTRLNEEPMWVQGIFEREGKEVIVTRSKKLSVETQGSVTEGSASKTEEKLDELIGIPRELFRKMYHKRQKEGGFFLDMTPKDINDFLTSSLGLDEYKKKVQVVDTKIKELSDKNDRTNIDIHSANAGLDATKNALLSIGSPPVKEVDQETLLALKSKKDESEITYNQFLHAKQMDEKALEFGRPSVTFSPFDRELLNSLEKEYSNLEMSINNSRAKEIDRQNMAKLKLSQYTNKINALESQIAKGEESNRAISNLVQQIKKIKSGKCYTCGQDWVDSVTENELLNNIKNLKEYVSLGDQAKEAMPSVLIEVNALKSEIHPMDDGNKLLSSKLTELRTALDNEKYKEKEHTEKENFRIRSAMDKFELSQKHMRDSHKSISEALLLELETDKRAFESSLHKFKSYESSKAKYDLTFNTLKNQENNYFNKINELENLSKETTLKISMAEEIKRALKSYLSRSFDEALDMISDNATKLIRHIPNMANCTIQLEGLKETKEGKIKEEVNATIHIDGEENVDIRSLSGGERTSLDLAIDISVIDMLESKAGKGIDILILDEPFGGSLDTPCIEMTLEILKNSNSNKRLVIVDHNEEIKQMIESQLTVVRNGDTSNIVRN